MAKKKEEILEQEIVENIHNETVESIMGSRYATYAKYVIQDRAIPDARDGLKPVQRRIIFSMYKSGNIFTGCNVENRSYGLTNCAERSALFSGVSSGEREIAAVAIAAPLADYPVGPCGACRQVLTEFAEKNVPVIFGSSLKNVVTKTLGELYPFDSLHELAEN